MTARLTVEEKLNRLRRVRDEGDIDKIRETAVQNLSDTTNLVVAVMSRRMVPAFRALHITFAWPETSVNWPRDALRVANFWGE